MGYAELSPERLLELGFAAPEVTGSAWSVRWDAEGPAAAELWSGTPPTVDFHTSGSTGPSRSWRRLRENLWLEAGMLADLVAPDEPEAAVCFAPPTHIYGALASVLVPARLGVPAWYRSTFFGAMPDVGRGRVVVVATPWIFTLLLQHLDWVRGLEHVTVLYGSAMLPATAGEFLREAGPGRARIVEVLGSTEAGGIASRCWREGAPPAWTLFPDVSFAGPAAAGSGTEDDEVPLVVTSPRLAFKPGQPPLSTWEADDRIRPLDHRTFRLTGRTGRLVKVNGRRINLDEAEYSLRAVLACADLALVPISDQMIGEHVELLIVPNDGTELSDLDLSAAFAQLGVRPKSVRAVPRIHRSALGKLRQGRAPETDNAEVVTG
ncbi:acyl-coenzyme A synthetase/AMP-(fatty) acid ligase [Saccharothrix tamanrassetensis]|uniref:Acyl-coenzyme A synthetase/AMP-(Fatty) acid ligase n=1 Tax=Saccharothrix tamanrassetensis TaxID=1051531 RepID=A0A841CR60_9PSEU|nr:AMP-binding protein [Saccharothrix tamanrassetensis]MBB5958527.1 acyl-coenzyme A synthetase/AMP-(fatty) acid ligase [Saccharothrix tamanrassetensis]